MDRPPEHDPDRPARQPPAEPEPTAAQPVESPPRPRKDWTGSPRWFAAEIIVVVAGVLIALAANAWWERQRTDKLELELLRAVHVELVANRAELQRILQATDECLDRTDQFLRRTPASLAAAPRDSTFALVAGFSCRQTFEPVLGAARAITGVPGFDSVRDIRIRTAVGNWLTALSDADEERDILTDEGRAIYAALVPYALDGATVRLADFPTIPNMLAAAPQGVVGAIRGDAGLVRGVVMKAHHQRAYGVELTEALVVLDSALALLDAATR